MGGGRTGNMHAMWPMCLMMEGDFHRGCRSPTAVQHHVFLDVRQHRAPVQGLGRLTTTHDVRMGCSSASSRVEATMVNGLLLWRSTDRPSIAGRSSRHATCLDLRQVERARFRRWIDVGDMRGPSKPKTAPKRAATGVMHMSWTSRNSASGSVKAETTASENPRNRPMKPPACTPVTKPIRGTVNLGHMDG